MHAGVRGWAARLGAPAAFLAAVTVAVLRRPRRPARERSAVAPAIHRRRLDYRSPLPRRAARRDARCDRRALRHDRRRAALAQSQARPGQDPGRAPRQGSLTSARVPRRVFGVAAALAALVGLPSAAAAAAPPPLHAGSYYVVSAYDGATLAARNASERRAPASITKLMTVLVALEHAGLDEVVTVPAAAAGIGESTMFLRAGRAGDRARPRDRRARPERERRGHGARLHAGDGSIPRFVALMNEKARRLGLRDTHYVNPHGLDAAGHVSSARDAVRLARAALQESLPSRTLCARARHARDRAHASPRPTTCSRATRRSSAARPATRPLRAGRRSPPRARAVSPSSRPCSASRPGRSGTTIWRRCSAGRSREYDPWSRSRAGPHVRARSHRLRPPRRAAGRASPGRATGAGREAAGRAGRRSGRRWRFRSSGVGVSARCASTTAAGSSRASPLVAAEAVAEPERSARRAWYAERTLHHLGGLVS